MTESFHSQDFRAMTDEEIKAQIAMLQAELEARKWAKVAELMTRLEALTSDELTELIARAMELKRRRHQDSLMEFTGKPSESEKHP
jgi:phage terminase small subunit